MVTNYKKIAVAMDFSNQSLKAFDRAVSVAKENGAMLLLVNVVDTKSFGSVAAYDLKYADQLKKECEVKIEEIKKQAIASGVKNVETMVEAGSPKVILTQLPNVNLIICGATGVNQMEKMVIGSVAERIVRNATCDVLIVR
ncbi:universal stress protein [Lysinibacillus antri]|uniref:Universal stress protein n=1 Tax=Lysinibacillus antri TaxID=2498145 RepID=A0A432LA20_9BACI|nr:universal stress protein [Lysinibacillus antri]RUL51083.1 universal stress protein [Lysinibacillus antri]